MSDHYLMSLSDHYLMSLSDHYLMSLFVVKTVGDRATVSEC